MLSRDDTPASHEASLFLRTNPKRLHLHSKRPSEHENNNRRKRVTLKSINQSRGIVSFSLFSHARALEGGAIFIETNA